MNHLSDISYPYTLNSLKIPYHSEINEKIRFDVYPLDTKAFEDIKEKYIDNLVQEIISVGLDEEVTKWKALKIMLEKWKNIPHHSVSRYGTRLHLTNQLQKWDRLFLVWYTEDGNIRMFYKSLSEWFWRSCPGVSSSSKQYVIFSKAGFLENSSYESTTPIDEGLNTIFNTFPIEPCPALDPITLSMDIWGFEYNKPEMEQETHITAMFPNLPRDAMSFYQDAPSEAVKNFYTSFHIPEMDMENMHTIPQKNYSFHHNYLWLVEVEVMRAKRNDQDIDIHFAIPEKDSEKIYINKIIPSDAFINSFGIYNRQLNIWPLAIKPIDYEDQLPEDFKWAIKNYKYLIHIPKYQQKAQEIVRKFPIVETHFGNYYDIRELFQETPLIKSYKEYLNQKKNKEKNWTNHALFDVLG